VAASRLFMGQDPHSVVGKDNRRESKDVTQRDIPPSIGRHLLTAAHRRRVIWCGGVVSLIGRLTVWKGFSAGFEAHARVLVTNAKGR
jgi:hypothetical protein